MTKLILVKSGSTDWDKHDRFKGLVDVPANSEGMAFAGQAATELVSQGINAVYSGCLSRCYDVARVIADGTGIKAKKVEALNALNHGLWQGLCLDEVKKRYRRQFGLWRSSPFSTKPPNGESMREAYDRVVSFIQKILDKHRGGTVCIVSHSIILSLIKCHFTCRDVAEIWDVFQAMQPWEVICMEEDGNVR
ncbi:MAG: histidine phosphatase family protein [Candidatus Omnitrophota bacterium]